MNAWRRVFFLVAPSWVSHRHHSLPLLCTSSSPLFRGLLSRWTVPLGVPTCACGALVSSFRGLHLVDPRLPNPHSPHAKRMSRARKWNRRIRVQQAADKTAERCRAHAAMIHTQSSLKRRQRDVEGAGWELAGSREASHRAEARELLREAEVRRKEISRMWRRKRH